ncbi:cytochrome c oxidase subunit 3 [Microvirga puerhi]|uniref:Cytochrome c oxidase subunit 3 n=1 Tax=Microvirga puerhi TaxID=2876078 RepID=A0ABS7VJL5_9HYPH|nr:cytochrome c oxidase subunit 3 [Microvirga puerhi]MBZ6075707.1 cytochrome c oxidase subunit 3 [Microvirga puerhi]
MTQGSPVHEPYTEASQQHEANMLGMFIFLGTEIMLFGGLFAAIMVYRIEHREQLIEASKRLYLWIGTANTVILLTSSLLVALAVQASRAGSRRVGATLLVASACMGVGFLGLKGIEYAKEWQEGLLPLTGVRHAFSGPVQELFMGLYLAATGLHAVHLTIGIALMVGLSWRVGRGSLRLPQKALTVELCGLYWHLVDIIWIFLFPALYLVR